MVNGRWRDISIRLASIGLFASAGAQSKLMEMDDPFKVIEVAKKLGISGVLNEDILQNIVERSGSTQSRTEEGEQENLLDELVPVLDGTEHDGQQTPTQGRVIAPINTAEPEPPSRPHNLPHFSLDGFPMMATEVDTELKVHFDITGKSTTEGKLSDMLSLFNNRLEKLKRILIQSGRMRNRPIDVSQVIRDQSRYSSNSNTATIVGLVNDVRYKGENLHFRIEDKSGDVFCVLRPPRAMDSSPEAKRRNAIAIAGLMNDDVIGVTGFINPGSRDMFLVDDVHLPPLPKHDKRAAPADQAVSVAFLSDLHLGSNTFLHAQWEKLAKWFHEDPLAKTVKYLILSGDVVDGVGIYPGQESELNVVDLYKQYEGVARLIEQLPDWLETVILPGNHDAVRPAEPQPALEPRIQEYFNSTTFAGNPCEFSLHGVRVLSYHGVSIMDFVSGLRNVSFSQPELAMQEMLERRHLAPSWRGKTPLSPEPEDHMVIETVPDIFVTGHVHGHYCGEHKGITMVHSSTWQDQTSYQRMLGFQPKPCILTVVNLHTHKTATIPFA